MLWHVTYTSLSSSPPAFSRLSSGLPGGVGAAPVGGAGGSVLAVNGLPHLRRPKVLACSSCGHLVGAAQKAAQQRVGVSLQGE